MSDMKNTLEQLVIEKAQAQQSAQGLTQLLITLAVKSGGELRLAKADWDKAEGYGVRIDPVGKSGQKITAVKQEQ